MDPFGSYLQNDQSQILVKNEVEFKWGNNSWFLVLLLLTFGIYNQKKKVQEKNREQFQVNQRQNDTRNTQKQTTFYDVYSHWREIITKDSNGEQIPTYLDITVKKDGKFRYNRKFYLNLLKTLAANQILLTKIDKRSDTDVIYSRGSEITIGVLREKLSHFQNNANTLIRNLQNRVPNINDRNASPPSNDFLELWGKTIDIINSFTKQEVDIFRDEMAESWEALYVLMREQDILKWQQEKNKSFAPNYQQQLLLDTDIKEIYYTQRGLYEVWERIMHNMPQGSRYKSSLFAEQYKSLREKYRDFASMMDKLPEPIRNYISEFGSARMSERVPFSLNTSSKIYQGDIVVKNFEGDDKIKSAFLGSCLIIKKEYIYWKHFSKSTKLAPAPAMLLQYYSEIQALYNACKTEASDQRRNNPEGPLYSESGRKNLESMIEKFPQKIKNYLINCDPKNSGPFCSQIKQGLQLKKKGGSGSQHTLFGTKDSAQQADLTPAFLQKT